MRRYFTRNKLAVKRSSSSLLLKWPLFLLFLILILCTTWLLYRHHSRTILVPGNYFSRWTAGWLAMGKNLEATESNLKPEKKLEVIESESLSENTNKPIVFEFYDRLPKSQVPRPVVVAQQEKKTTISNSTQLENDLAAQLRQPSYVVQLGMYNSMTAAMNYKQTLARAGFKVNIATLNVKNHEVYRIQLGPYSILKSAKIAQKKLQTRGIVSLVKKIERNC